jgi:hypothetical protein
VLSGGAYFWRPQELAPKQCNPGSPLRGGADWSHIDQGAALHLTRIPEMNAELSLAGE